MEKLIKAGLDTRIHGQYVFWRTEERKKGYVSRFLQLKASKAKKAKKTTDQK